MPAAKKLPTIAEYEALNRDGSGEKKNCGVIAIAAATGAPYAKVKELLAAQGRKDGGSTYYGWTANVMRQLGFGLIERSAKSFTDRYPGSHALARCVTTHHPDRYSKVWTDGKTYLLRGNRHILCVKDGRNLDWTRGKSMRVREIYEVIPAVRA